VLELRADKCNFENGRWGLLEGATATETCTLEQLEDGMLNQEQMQGGSGQNNVMQ
jgi:hypothetical protein